MLSYIHCRLDHVLDNTLIHETTIDCIEVKRNIIYNTYVCCQFGRVVKASDSKSDGVTRAGSNPAADVTFFNKLYHYKLIQTSFIKTIKKL